MTRANVNEMNVQTVEVRYELRQGVQFGLCLSPVVVRSPITHQFPEFCELYTLRLIIDRLSVGPSRGGDAPPQIGELLVRELDPERTNDVAGRRRSPT